MFHQARITSNTMRTVKQKLLIQRLIISEHRAALSAGYGFHRVKTERSHVRNRTVGSPFIFCADDMRSVLN